MSDVSVFYLNAVNGWKNISSHTDSLMVKIQLVW